MAAQLYTSAAVYIDGALLSESVSVKVDRKTNAQEINTMVKGWSGVSPGSASMTVSIENAVPSADFEVDAGRFMKSNQFVELTIFAAGRTLTSKGVIMSDSFNAAVNSEAKVSFEFIGEWAEWT